MPVKGESSALDTILDIIVRGFQWDFATPQRQDILLTVMIERMGEIYTKKGVPGWWMIIYPVGGDEQNGVILLCSRVCLVT